MIGTNMRLQNTLIKKNAPLSANLGAILNEHKNNLTVRLADTKIRKMIKYYLSKKETRGNKEFFNLTFSVSFCTSNTSGLKQITKIVELAEKHKAKIYGKSIVGAAQYNDYTIELTEKIIPNKFKNYDFRRQDDVFDVIKNNPLPKDKFFVELETMLKNL